MISRTAASRVQKINGGGGGGAMRPRAPACSLTRLENTIRIMYIFSILSGERSHQLCIKDKRPYRCLWLNMCIYIHNYTVAVFIRDRRGRGQQNGAVGPPGHHRQSHTRSRVPAATMNRASFEYADAKKATGPPPEPWGTPGPRSEHLNAGATGQLRPPSLRCSVYCLVVAMNHPVVRPTF